MVKKSLICRVCQYSGADSEPIAYFDPDTISMPLIASMFIPITDESPFPPREPGLPDTQWYFLRCPFCGGNPFGIPEMTEEELDNLDSLEILTANGSFIVRSEAYKAEQAAKHAILFEKHSLDLLKIVNPLKCLICGKVCKSEFGLRSHMRSHQRGENDR